jgi:hypothetical protein
MKKGWTTTKLIAAGSMGVLLWVFSIGGAALAAVVGFFAMSGIINMFVQAAVFTSACLILRKFGAGAITGSVFAILALPLPLLGTPGFLPKVIMGFLVGLVADTTFYLLRRRERLAAFATGAATQFILGFLFAGFGRLFGIQGFEKFPKFLTTLPGAFIPAVIVGLFGGGAGYFGWVIYRKIENACIVKRIQGE